MSYDVLFIWYINGWNRTTKHFHHWSIRKWWFVVHHHVQINQCNTLQLCLFFSTITIFCSFFPDSASWVILKQAWAPEDNNFYIRFSIKNHFGIFSMENTLRLKFLRKDAIKKDHVTNWWTQSSVMRQFWIKHVCFFPPSCEWCLLVLADVVYLLAFA